MHRFIIALGCLVLLSGVASAHGVGAVAKLKGNEVTVEGYFDDDAPAVDAKVTVLDEAGAEVWTGKTDAQGFARFPAPKPGRYRVTLDAGAGHLAKIKLVIPEAGADGTVSDGPTRQDRVENRWWMAGLGLLILGGFYVVSRRMARV